MSRNENKWSLDSKRPWVDPVAIQDARLMFRPNFSGEPDPWSNEKRTFDVRIDDSELAQALTDDRWNVKTYVDKETGEVISYLPVEIRFHPDGGDRDRQPKVYLVTPDGCSLLSEEHVGILDRIGKIEKMDIAINPYVHDRNTRGNDEWEVKAYLDEGYFYVIPKAIESRKGEFKKNAEAFATNMSEEEDVPF